MTKSGQNCCKSVNQPFDHPLVMPAAEAAPADVKSNEVQSLIAAGDLHSRNGEWERAVTAYSKVRRP